MNWLNWLKRPPAPDRRADALDAVLLAAPNVAWRARDLVQGVFVSGATGSGKTTGPLAAILRAALRAGCGGLFLSAKRGEAAEHVALAESCGRGADVAIVDRHARYRVNLCDAVDHPAADVSTRAALIASGIFTLMEVAGRGGGTRGGAEGDRFWQQSASRFLQNIVLLLLIAGVRVTPSEVMRVLQSLPTSPRALTTERFRAGACFQALNAAYANRAGREAEYRAVKDWALVEVSALSPKTKSVVVATLTGALDAASRGVVQTLIATDTTLDLAEAIRANRVIVCDFPYPEWMDTARFVYAALKHMTQLEALRRAVTPATRPFLLVADEYQNVVSEHDFLFASMSRSSRCPLVVCTQGHESLHAVFPGDNGRAKVNTLLGNLVSKFYCLPTPTTAAELCESLGRRKRYLANASTQAGGYASPLDVLVPGPSRASGGVSETYESVLFPSELARMRTGGPGNGNVVDALLVQSGRVFDTGYLFRPHGVPTGEEPIVTTEPNTQPSEFRKSVALTSNLLMCLSWPLRALCTAPGTMGHREARSVNAYWGLGMLVLWALLSASQVLLYGGGLLALAALAEHRRKSARGVGVHSFAMGSSVFARRLGERAGRWLEAAGAVALGLAAADDDRGAATYLMAAGLGHAWTLAFVYAREAAIQDDLDDAAIEGAHRAARREDRPLF